MLVCRNDILARPEARSAHCLLHYTCDVTVREILRVKKKALCALCGVWLSGILVSSLFKLRTQLFSIVTTPC